MRDTEETRPWAAKRDGSAPAIARLARTNRSRPTDAERRMWRLLRELDTGGTHFRRQVVLEGFILDFACMSARLAIEVDGGQHCDSEADAARSAKIEAQGWRVLRFWNNEVLRNPEGVAQRVMEALGSTGGAISGTTPTPDPSPQGGGEKGASFPNASRSDVGPQIASNHHAVVEPSSRDVSDPLPLVGRVRVGVAPDEAEGSASSVGDGVATSGTTPTPDPSPQAGGA